ncbi:hypothetical protein MASR2M74_19320 [Paracoccaceae bacterium]
MAAVAVILGGSVGFMAALVTWLIGLPLLTGLGVWSLGGAAVAALLLLASGGHRAETVSLSTESA